MTRFGSYSLCILFSALIFTLAYSVEAAEVQTPTLKIPRVSRPPRLEDFINGTPREAEAVVSDFRQFDPKDGSPVSQPTTAYLSYDDNFLYVGWICSDDPALVRAHMMKRDNLLSEDRVSIGIDTFHDHRRNYWFDVNPLGIQMDGTTTDSVDDFTFDTLWYSEGRLTEDGYVVLQKIPFKSLRFSKSPLQDWAIVLNRMIQRNNEMSCWPYVTRRLLPGWTSQFGHLDGIERISPGRNLQFIPYGIFSRSRFLDSSSSEVPSFRTENDPRAGLDAKLVLRDALTLDMTLNPDFSQVESDEPQVTVNQRYEVFFPEKRPFFIENAPLFQTPERLFFSRRIVDPQLGARLSGKFGGWALGALVADDRAPAQLVSDGMGEDDDRATVAVMRLQREVGRESRVGMLVTSRDLGAAANRVFSADSKFLLNRNWTLTGQLMTSHSRAEDGKTLQGPAYYAQLAKAGRNFHGFSIFRERSPDFRSDLGFFTRVDIRQSETHAHYQWRPEEGAIVSFGPSVFLRSTWDTTGELQDWEVESGFSVDLTGMTRLGIGHEAGFERFRDLEFRKQEIEFDVSTEWFRWLAMSASSSFGEGINYYPTTGYAPFLADSQRSHMTVVLRPTIALTLENTYIYSRLGISETHPLQSVGGDSIFNNHIGRAKINYQFSPALSFRTIVDYNSILPNSSLVSLEKTKKLGADLLLTYMVNPWTALHLGYTDWYENLAFDPMHSPAWRRSETPDMSVGRQFFVKLNYLIRM